MKLKILIIGIGLLTVSVKAQFSVRNPTNVRYIAGGYINSSPFFKTLDAALNDVKTKATVDNPYVFWIAGDTTKIADWDSTYSGSLLSIRDSINIYYVGFGKIKWAGFGFGGSGSGTTTTTLLTPGDHTTHYNYPTYNSHLGSPYDSVRVKDYAIDQDIYDLIVYTDTVYLYIQNDTLKVNINNLKTALQSLTSWSPYDTTTLVRTFGTQTIRGIKTFTSGIVASDTGYIQINTYHPPSLAKVIYGSNDSVFYSADGVTAKTFAFVNQVKTLLQAKIDTNYVTVDTSSFSGTDSVKIVTVYGADTSDVYTVSAIMDSTSPNNINDLTYVKATSTGFYVKRGTGGTADLKFAWIRRKR